MRRTFIATLLIVLALGIAYTVPSIPVSLPPDVWTEEEFEKLKPRIEAASEKLNQMTFALTEAGYNPPVTYNLIAKSGRTSFRRPLIGSWRFGASHQSTWSFGTWMLPGVPNLEYDSTEGTAQIGPEKVWDFLKWVESTTEYPDGPNPKAQQGGDGDA